MNDGEIMHRITRLVDEEQELLRRGGEHQGLTPEEHQRLESIQVTLDQLWDYLRQRRARRHAGQDPDDAHVRPPEVVERYLQ